LASPRSDPQLRAAVRMGLGETYAAVGETFRSLLNLESARELFHCAAPSRRASSVPSPPLS
jgi:hypothetical protein